MSKTAKELEDELRVSQRARQSAEAEIRRLTMRVVDLEKEAKKASPKKGTKPPPSSGRVDNVLDRVNALRELLASTAVELSQLHADEVALSKKRARVLADACAVLARAVGETGKAPPPVPSAGLEKRLSVAPSVDISEVAVLLESLRPPRAPKL